jgi:hypothetical protein
MENKRTAVDWLFEKITQNEEIRWRGTQYRELFEQAKEIEKEQHGDTWNHGSYSLLDHGSGEDFEQYYNETYNKQ